MKVLSELQDSRVNSVNVLCEMNVSEYIELAKNCIDRNVYQRKRIKSSKTVYSLLKEDLKAGCVIPPLVLALKTPFEKGSKGDGEFADFITAESNRMLILDGLQRTYTLLELQGELESSLDRQALSKFLKLPLRVEIYLGVDTLGILYRMLTLNTGQSPMSLRQQVEMLYLDYLEHSPDNIKLLKESDARPVKKLKEYSFKDVIEGFNSYLERNELPITKSDLLDNVETLERLQAENKEADLFRDYLLAINGFVESCFELEEREPFDADEYEGELPSKLFGDTTIKILKRAQVYSGFGAAMGRLIDNEMAHNIKDFFKENYQFKDDGISGFIYEVNKSMEVVKDKSPKIGNAQRVFFQFFFRDFFNKDSDSHQNLEKSAKSALRKYLTNYL